MKSLEETLRLYRFYNSCQEFESWMEDKENVLNTFSTDEDNLGVVQAKYEVKTSIKPQKCGDSYGPTVRLSLQAMYLH